MIPFVLEKIVETYDLHDPRAKEAAFGTLKQFLSGLSQIIKDAYIPMAASLLGVAPAMFGAKTKPERARENFSQPKDDVAQLSILKTLVEKPELIDFVLDVVDINMFGNYAPLFTALLNNETEHPHLMGLKQITADRSMPFSQKVFLIRKIKTDIIPRLKHGELVPYDDSI